MGLGTQTLCMRDVVNDRSGWKNSDQSDGWIHSHSIWPLSFAPLGLRPTNDQILTKKDADGKEKVSKSEDEWDSGVDKNGHGDSRIWPAGDNNDNSTRIGLIPADEPPVRDWRPFARRKTGQKPLPA